MSRDVLPKEKHWMRKLQKIYMPYRANGNAVEIAAWTHAEFVKIHPYVDGNGRHPAWL